MPIHPARSRSILRLLCVLAVAACVAGPARAIAMVGALQWLGNRLARRFDHR